MHLLFVILESVSILVFGHSYGADCTEYLPSLAKEAGIENLYVGRFNKANCSMEEHYKMFAGDSARSYNWCPEGQVDFKKGKRITKKVIAERKWDYVIFQNSLENAGRYEMAQPYLNEMISYVRKVQHEKFGNNPKIGWNMFWPISKLREDGSHKLCTYRLSFYDNSSDKMWEEYQKTAKRVLAETDVDFAIPTGVAVMLFRASRLNTPEAKELTRDGYHMSYGGGRYLAACTMFEKLLTPIYKKSVVGNSFRTDKTPVPVTDNKTALTLQKMAQKAARTQIKK